MKGRAYNMLVAVAEEGCEMRDAWREAIDKSALEALEGMVVISSFHHDELGAIAATMGTTTATDPPQQVVIPGDHDSFVEAASRMRARGDRAIQEDTGPFHTPQSGSATPLALRLLAPRVRACLYNTLGYEGA